MYLYSLLTSLCQHFVANGVDDPTLAYIQRPADICSFANSCSYVGSRADLGDGLIGE